MTSINDLPREMVKEILGHLDRGCKKTCRLVCEPWRAILDYHFHKFDVFLNDTTVKYVLNCRNPMHYVTVGELRETRLAISSTRNRSCFASTKFVGIKSTNSHANLIHILRATGETAEYLAFANFTLRNMKSNAQVWKSLDFPVVQQLSVSLTEFDAKHHQAVVGLFQHGFFPSLTKFHVDFVKPFGAEAPDGYPMSSYVNICPVLYKFVLRHKSTLKKLALILPNNLFGSISTSAATQYTEILEGLIEDFKTLDLIRLGVNIPAREVGLPWSLGRQLLHSQTHIKNLVLLGRPLTESDAQIIQKNTDTLEILFWASTTTTSISAPEHLPYAFDCSILRDCAKLMKLELITSRPVRNIESLPVNISKLTWSADLNLTNLRWITKHLVNLTYLSLVVENYIAVETYASITPITCTILANDILPMPNLVKFNLQCHCHLQRILDYCETCDGLTAAGRNGLTIYIDRQIFKPLPWPWNMDNELFIIELAPFLNLL